MFTYLFICAAASFTIDQSTTRLSGVEAGKPAKEIAFVSPWEDVKPSSGQTSRNAS